MAETENLAGDNNKVLTVRGLENLTVLVADDRRQMRVLMRSMLRAYGFRKIREVSDGREAFAAACEDYIDIAFLDWAMAGLEGAELTEKLRTDPAVVNPYCTIIMVSGHSHIARVARARDCGVNTFLAKPVSANSVRQHLRFVFNECRPFIRAPRYVGPDRRVGKAHRYGGLMRRATDRVADEAVFL